jgi:hypothetical protein
MVFLELGLTAQVCDEILAKFSDNAQQIILDAEKLAN